MSDTCTADATARLNKIEGQIRGIRNMLGEDRGCVDILMQISAASASLTNVAKLILEHHIEHCVADAIKNGEEAESLRDLKRALEQFAKMK